MDMLLETCELTKSYKGRTVVNHVSIHVKKGEIYGFVGPNGAGKTTILKMLLHLTLPDSGSIHIFGAPLYNNTFEHLKRIGSIIENPYFYDHLTGYENLKLHCGYMGYHNTEDIQPILEQVGLQNIEDKAVTHYSLGMKQRLAIARAMLTKPEFLILDEPVNALDPEGILNMRSLFCRLKEENGTTILISSHILSEVELIADTIGIIKNGELKKETSMSDIHNHFMEYLEIQVDDPGRACCLLEEALHITNYTILSDSTVRIFDPTASGKEISALLVAQNIALESLYKKKHTLEDYFFQLTGEENK